MIKVKPKTPKQVASYFPRKPYLNQSHRIHPAYTRNFTPSKHQELAKLVRAKGWAWMSLSAYGLTYSYVPDLIKVANLCDKARKKGKKNAKVPNA